MSSQVGKLVELNQCCLIKGLASTCFDFAQHKSLSQRHLKICCLSGAEGYIYIGRVLI